MACAFIDFFKLETVLMSFNKYRLAALACFTTLLLSACGGSTGFPPVITGVKVQSLKYGHTATIYLGGKDLRSSLKVESNAACTNPSFASNSTTDTLVLNCGVLAVGDLPLTIKADDGSVIYTTTLKVPNPQVTLFTTKGTVVLELDPATAPISSNNYLSYISKGFYTNTLFHRVISGFMIQGGGYTTGMVKKTGQSAAIALESNKGLSNSRGTLAMARTNVFNSATSEFFINVVDNTFLDYINVANPGYAVFGKVVQGMDVVDTIVAEPTGVLNGFSDVPLTDVVISLALQTQ
jgi:peptidyl-prolyl cis-trans isomerase A (cyclophilin A)